MQLTGSDTPTLPGSPPSATVAVGPSGRVTYVSEAFAQVVGLPRDALVDCPAAQVFGTDVAAALLGASERRSASLPADGRSYVPIERADGERTWVVAEFANVGRSVLMRLLADGERAEPLTAEERAQVVFDLAVRFVDASAEDVVGLIQKSLAGLASAVDADLASLYYVNSARMRIDEIARWRRLGSAHGSLPKSIPLDGLEDALAHLTSTGVIRIDDVHDVIDQDPGPLRESGMRTAVVVPLSVAGDNVVLLVGTVGRTIDWSDEEVEFLHTASGLFERALIRARRERRVMQAFDEGPLAISVEDGDGRVVESNATFRQLVAYNRGPTDRLPMVSDLIVEPDHAGDATPSSPGAVRIRGRDGSERWMRHHLAELRDPVTMATNTVSVIEDITELHEQSMRLARSEERFRRMVEETPAMLFRVDTEGRVLMCNREVERLGPIKREDFVGVRIADLISEDQEEVRRIWESNLARVLEEKVRVDADLVVEVGEGEHLLIEARAVPELDEDGEVETMLVIAVDVTERRALAQQVAHAATHDSVTGIPRRSVLEKALRDLLASSPAIPPALLFVDLDRFKVVNDSLGHAVGDEVLRIVANRIASHIRSVDLAARLGGDEFAVLVPHLDEGDVVAFANRLRHVIEKPIIVDGTEVRQTVSVGVASAVRGSDPEELVVRADRAMYAAKQKGRNRCEVFDDGLRGAYQLRSDLERELALALERRELVMHYQPEVCLDDRSVVGMEALLRWEHPTRGLLTAASFIDVANESGLMREIGPYVIDSAIEGFARVCRAMGREDLCLRVNLAAPQLLSPTTVAHVRRAIDVAGIDPGSVCLELTESVVMRDPDAARRLLDHMHRLGVSLAIDDFGTGYSSLSYLRTFPVDWVKIDQSFVCDLHEDTHSAAIVGAVVGLAEAMHFDVVAEGVERDVHVDALLELGVHRAQGYLFAPALSADDFVARFG